MTDLTDRRIEARLPVRRLNVLIAGAVLSTVDISNEGAQVHCPASQFSLVEPLLESDIELVIELPIGREVTAFADLSYVRKSSADVFIGFAFRSFKFRDKQGWQAFIAAKQRELIRTTSENPCQKYSAG